jgi:hypothetical protein
MSERNKKEIYVALVEQRLGLINVVPILFADL